MKHIQQVLIENMTQGMGTAEPFNDSIHELASKWSSYFDQKALRASMLTELYRKSMVSSVSNTIQLQLLHVKFNEHRLLLLLLAIT